MLPEKTKNLILFIRDACIKSRIGNMIAGTAVAIDNVFAFVEAAFKCDPYGAFLGTTPDKILFLVFEQIKKHPRDSLDDRSLTSAILACNGGRAA